MKAKKTKYFFQKTEGVHKLYIYDDITARGKFNWQTWEYDESETSATHFSEMLEEIPQDSEIEIHINSYGGEVKEGVAIYNLLMQHKARKTAYVDGFACSAATLPLMACDKIIMGLGTYMLIHNMWTEVSGNAEDLRKAADDLDTLMGANRQIYLSRMNCTEEELINLMAEEKYLTPDECLKLNLCDEINRKIVAADTGGMQEQLQQLAKERKNQSFLNQEVESMIRTLCAKKTPGEPKENNFKKAAVFFEMLGK